MIWDHYYLDDLSLAGPGMSGAVAITDYVATYTRQLTEATPESVRRTAQAIYGRPGYRLIVRPMPVRRW